MSPGMSSDGFSRNSSTRPSASIGTRPYGRASSTWVSAIVATAPRSRCLASIPVRSRSVRMSPLTAKKGSSVPMAPSAFTIAPPVPSGSVSVIQVIDGWPPRAWMNAWKVPSRYELDSTTSCTPWPARWSSTWSRLGRSRSGMSGLGRVSVIGRRRVPSPPTSTTAFIGSRVLGLRDEDDAYADERDPRPTQRRHRLVQHELVEEQDQHVRERGERVGERERGPRQHHQPDQGGQGEEEQSAPDERLADDLPQRGPVQREGPRCELVVHEVHAVLERQLRDRGQRDGEQDQHDQHRTGSFRLGIDRVGRGFGHRSSTSTATETSTRSCTRGASTTSNRYRWVCTWYRCPVARFDSPTVTQYFPGSYGKASIRKRTRFFSNRPRSRPAREVRASSTAWLVAPSRTAKSTSSSSSGSCWQTSITIMRGSPRRIAPSLDPLGRTIWTSAISASRVPSSGTKFGSVTPRRTYRISRTTSPGLPIACNSPWWSIAARSQISITVSSACVTSTIVRPSRWNARTRSRHLAWKASSPTARTSSISRTSGSTCTATANPSRTSMPDE